MDPKDPKDPTPGNPNGNQKGNPDPNVIALQQKLTEKDREFRALQDKLAMLEKNGTGESETKKMLADMGETIKTLGSTISNMEKDKERERLRSQYPDIVPDMIIGRTPEEIERLVKEQRDTIEKNYVRQPSAHAPQYASRSEIETEMEKINADKTIPIATKFQKIRDLKIQRDEF